MVRGKVQTPAWMLIKGQNVRPITAGRLVLGIGHLVIILSVGNTSGSGAAAFVGQQKVVNGSVKGRGGGIPSF